MNIISNFKLKKYVVSFSLAFIITLLVLSVAGIIFSLFPIPDVILGFFCDYSWIFSGFIASFLCARKSSRRGFINGAISCIIYIGLLLLIGFFVFGNNIFSVNLLRIFGLSALVGGIGGILGINSK